VEEGKKKEIAFIRTGKEETKLIDCGQESVLSTPALDRENVF